MADGRKNNGGKRPGAGRKPRTVELGLPALLDEVVSEAEQKAIIKKLVSEAKTGSYKHLELYMAYRYGKPADKVDMTSNGETINSLPLAVIFKDFSDKSDT